MVKLLSEEEDSRHYVDLLENKQISICDLGVTEVLGALMAKERMKFLTPAQRRDLWVDFNRAIDDGSVSVIAVSAQAYRKAEQYILHCHPKVALRAMDAIHLAACDLEQVFPLVTNDEKMAAAAKLLGIPVLT